MRDVFNYGIDQLSIAQAIAIANGKLKASLNKQAIEKIKASRLHVQKIVDENKTVYGITTGFGILANTKISSEDTVTLQHRLLESHSVGVGDPVPIDIAKLMLITKVQ